jgi:hypothetical protein
MTQFAMDWGLCMGSLVIAIPAVLAVTLTSDPNSEVDEGQGANDSKEKSQLEVKV